MLQPENVLMLIRAKGKREWRICFFSTICFGLLAHFYKIVNWLPNWDSLLNQYTDQNKLELGRCFLSVACSFSSYYDLPWINGLFSLVYIALAAVCVSELFQMKKTIPLILIGGLMVTFPTVTSTMAYNYTADGYFLALLCMCIAVLLIARYRKGVIPAVFLIAFGMGIYQAYLTFAIVLILLYMMDQLLFAKINVRQFLHMILRFGICGLLGVLGYVLSMKGFLLLSDTSLSKYQSIDRAFAMQDTQVFYAFLKSGYRFLLYFFDFSQGINRFLLLNMFLWLLLAVFFFLSLYIERRRMKLWHLAFLLLCIAMLPFASYALYFASPNLDYHNLMVMCMCLFYLLPVLFYERLSTLTGTVAFVKQWTIIGFSVLTIFHFTVLANISYQKMQLAYEKSYGIIVRLADRVEQMPDADACNKIAVFGCLPGSESFSVYFPPDMTGITDSYIIRKQDTMMHENVTQAMLHDYCGIFYEDTTQKEIEEIQKNMKFRQMQCWPGKNSVAVIEDTLVIKFGDEQQ